MQVVNLLEETFRHAHPPLQRQRPSRGLRRARGHRLCPEYFDYGTLPQGLSYQTGSGTNFFSGIVAARR
jgi:hypothetical protein